MKTKDKKELFTKTVVELRKLLSDARKALVEMRLDHEQNKLKNTRDIFNKRKEIAVLQTLMNMKDKVVEEVKEEAEVIVKKAKSSFAKDTDDKKAKAVKGGKK